jgi:hypothetical protein
MSIKFRILRGNTAQAAAFVGQPGQLLWDTQAKRLYMHDGTTAGGSPVSGLTQAAVQALIDTSIGGLTAEDIDGLLDGGGKISANLLPSFVDDILEAATFGALPATGEAGKIYVVTGTNKTYRWGGTVYVEVSPSIGPASSDEVPEGVTNKYYTDVRARNAISIAGDAGLAYNPATGVLTYTAPTVPVAATGSEVVDGSNNTKFATPAGVHALLADIGFTKDGGNWVLDEGTLS